MAEELNDLITLLESLKQHGPISDIAINAIKGPEILALTIETLKTQQGALEALAKSTKYDRTSDTPIREDVEIQEVFHKMHQTKLGGKIYTYAHALVSAKHAKGTLIELVNWLIWKQFQATQLANAYQRQIGRMARVIEVFKPDDFDYEKVTNETPLTPDELKTVMERDNLEMKIRVVADRLKTRYEMTYDKGAEAIKKDDCLGAEFKCKKGTFTLKHLVAHRAAENDFGQSKAYAEARNMILELLPKEGT